MKSAIIKPLLLSAALVAGSAAAAQAHSSLSIGLGFFSPAPVYYAPAPVYYAPRAYYTPTYYAPAPVYYRAGYYPSYGTSIRYSNYHGGHHGRGRHGGYRGHY